MHYIIKLTKVLGELYTVIYLYVYIFYLINLADNIFFVFKYIQNTYRYIIIIEIYIYTHKN